MSLMMMLDLAPPPPVDVADDDTATFVEAETLTIAGVSVGDDDTATFVEAESIAGLIADADSAGFVETQSVTAGPFADADTGTLVDAATVAVQIAGADTAAMVDAESVAINFADGETLSFTESESIGQQTLPTDADAASFTESEHVDIEFVPPMTSADVLVMAAAGGGLSELTDTFPSFFLDAAKWTVESGAVTVGDNRAGVDTVGTGPTVLESARTYNARGGELVVRGARPNPDGPTVRASVQLVDPGGAVGIHQVGVGQLVLRIEHNGAADDLTVDYDPDREVYWRIRESLGQVMLATSPTGDPGSWTTYRQQPHLLNLTAVRVVLTASSYGASTWGHGPWGHTPWGGSE